MEVAAGVAAVFCCNAERGGSQLAPIAALIHKVKAGGIQSVHNPMRAASYYSEWTGWRGGVRRRVDDEWVAVAKDGSPCWTALLDGMSICRVGGSNLGATA